MSDLAARLVVRATSRFRHPVNVRFQAVATGGASPLQLVYSFSHNGQLVRVNGDDTFVATAPGFYHVVVSDCYGHNAASDSVTVKHPNAEPYGFVTDVADAPDGFQIL